MCDYQSMSTTELLAEAGTLFDVFYGKGGDWGHMHNLHSGYRGASVRPDSPTDRGPVLPPVTTETQAEYEARRKLEAEKRAKREADANRLWQARIRVLTMGQIRAAKLLPDYLAKYGEDDQLAGDVLTDAQLASVYVGEKE